MAWRSDCAVHEAVDFAAHLDVALDGLEDDALPEEAPAAAAAGAGGGAHALVLDENGENLFGQPLPDAELERRAHEWADAGAPVADGALDEGAPPPAEPPPPLPAGAPPDPPPQLRRPGGAPAAAMR
jgi:hypothetical protein